MPEEKYTLPTDVSTSVDFDKLNDEGKQEVLNFINFIKNRKTEASK